MTSHRHVVMFSGGIGSWAAARRVVDTHGATNTTLLFADTRAEHPDVYRFLHDAAADTGAELVQVADGRNPWQVFSDARFIGNNKVPLCSRILKQEPSRAWLEANTDPDHTTVYVGIDWTEMHRLPAIERNYLPWQAKAPLCEKPWRMKNDLLAEAKSRGLRPPSMYRLGFAHANCAGACVRAGLGAWAHLLRIWPDRYAEAEQQEQKLRAELGADVAILRDRTGGTTTPLTLTDLRERIEAGTANQTELDMDWGGCGCLPVSDNGEVAA